MPLKPLTLYRTVAAWTGGVLLSACSTFVPSPDPGQPPPESETVTLRCYWQFRLHAIDECHVSSVDGQRPGASQFASLKTELTPGQHWVEFKLQHAVGFGGTINLCAFEHDFLAGHHYRVLPHSLSADGERPRKHATPLYTGSMGLEETRPDGTVTVHRPALMCSIAGSLCRTTSDCVPHPDVVCQAQPGYAYGTCRKR